MIALAIAGIALITLLSLGNRAIATHGTLQHLTQATLLAQQKMTEVETLGQFDEDEGVFEPPHDGYRWRVTVEETPLGFVQMVTVTVLWGEERRNEMVDISSFFK